MVSKVYVNCNLLVCKCTPSLITSQIPHFCLQLLQGRCPNSGCPSLLCPVSYVCMARCGFEHVTGTMLASTDRAPAVCQAGVCASSHGVDPTSQRAGAIICPFTEEEALVTPLVGSRTRSLAYICPSLLNMVAICADLMPGSQLGVE